MNSLKTAAALMLTGLVGAGCSTIEAADRALTMYEPPSTSPYRGSRATSCPEWDRFVRKEPLEAQRWRFGCANAASLTNSVADKRDLVRGRSLRPGEGWEAKRVDTEYREGKFDPGQVDTTKSSTTSSN